MKRQVALASGKPGEDILLSFASDTEAFYGRLNGARELSRRAAESARRDGSMETAAEGKSASARTMVGFLPPISSWIRRCRRLAWACSQAPISQEPVKETALSEAALTRAPPNSPPEPATKLTTPLGRPAWCSASTMRQALSGAADAGLRTTVLPQISAGASFQAGMADGKFHGMM